MLTREVSDALRVRTVPSPAGENETLNVCRALHIPHNVSFGRNMFQRIRWQACRRFASCPSCHGLGAYTTVKKDNKKRKLVPAKDRFKVPA